MRESTKQTLPRTIFVLAIAAVVAGCSSVRVRTASDPAADFGRLHTFAWLPANQAAPADQFVQDRAVDKRLRADVASTLRAKGFTPAADGTDPDFLLNYRVSTTPASKMRTESARIGWDSGWWGGWAGPEVIEADNYEQGTLYIAVLDPKARRMIWIGAAEARLLPHISLERRLDRVDAAVEKTLADFPPRARK